MLVYELGMLSSIREGVEVAVVQHFYTLKWEEAGRAVLLARRPHLRAL